MKLFKQLNRSFLCKSSPRIKLTDIALLFFWLMLLPWMFISSYTIIYFFVKNFFLNVYISLNAIFECSYLFFGCKIGHPLSMCNTGGMEWAIQNVYGCVQGEGFEKSVIRHVRTKWMAASKCYGIVFVHWFGDIR